MKITAIILMAGLSTRFGGPKNKQLCLLGDEPVFSYSIRTFAVSKLCNNLILVVNKVNVNEIKKFVNENNIEAKIILGGKTRQESVENALKSVKLNDDDLVLIHDGARPMIFEKQIKEVAKAALKYGAATTYIEEINTIAIKDRKDNILEFIDRKTVASIQTPQCFKYALLKEAHLNAKTDLATDDCSLIMENGHPVKLVEGSKLLHKITTQEDLKYLEGLLR